jgi:CRP/FNR family transcriptional regulator, cyclic AMP receptor protein
MGEEQKGHFDKPVVYKKGQVIFAEGEPANFVYIIKRGLVTIFKEDGQRLLPIGQVQDQEFLGETSMFIDEVRTASAVASEQTEAFVIKKSEVKAVLKNCPDWVSEIMATLAERLSHSNEILREHRIISEDLEKMAATQPQELGKIRQAIEDYRSRRGIK